MGPLVGIDNRVRRIAAHTIGAQDVAGPFGFFFMMDRRAVHAPAYRFDDAPRCGQTVGHVVAKVVLQAGAWQAQGIEVVIVGHNAVLGVR